MLPKSNEARFEIINKCHYNCMICMKNQLSRKKELMSYSKFKYLIDKIIAETAQYKCISFAGIGEPLLNEELPAMIRYATKKGLQAIIVSNGDLLTLDKFIELQDAGLYSVRVSFHGLSKKGYSRLHGVPEWKFEKVKSQLETIFNHERKTKVLLTCVFVKGVNDGPIETWLKMWEGKADLMEIWNAHNWVSSLKNRESQEGKNNTCGRITNGPLQVQVDGTINSCCFDWDGKLEYGSLMDNTLHEIFESKRYKKILGHHESGDFDGSGLICQNCDQRNKNKDDVMIYSSKYDIKERVDMTSTYYDKVR